MNSNILRMLTVPYLVTIHKDTQQCWQRTEKDASSAGAKDHFIQLAKLNLSANGISTV